MPLNRHCLTLSHSHSHSVCICICVNKIISCKMAYHKMRTICKQWPSGFIVNSKPSFEVFMLGRCYRFLFISLSISLSFPLTLLSFFNSFVHPLYHSNSLSLARCRTRALGNAMQQTHIQAFAGRRQSE